LDEGVDRPEDELPVTDEILFGGIAVWPAIFFFFFALRDGLGKGA